MLLALINPLSPTVTIARTLIHNNVWLLRRPSSQQSTNHISSLVFMHLFHYLCTYD